MSSTDVNTMLCWVVIIILFIVALRSFIDVFVDTDLPAPKKKFVKDWEDFPEFHSN